MPTWRLWYKATLVAGMFLWGMFATSLLMPLLSAIYGRRAHSLHARIRTDWHRRVCRILGLRLQISGEPCAKSGLLVANHISWLDIIALGAHQPLVFVAKAEVADWPVLGFLARRIGTVFVQRGDGAQVDAAAETMTWLLRRGERLMLFPEGTTTNGDRVLRFHGKLLQPAHLAHVQVQAVALSYHGAAKPVAPFIGDDAFVPHLLRVLELDHVDMTIHYCPPLPLGLNRDNGAQTARRQVVDALGTERAERPCANG